MEYYYSDVAYGVDDEGNGSLEDILKSFYYITREKESFLTLVNNDKDVLQFICEGGENWIVDIPKMENNLTLQKKIDSKECTQLITDFYSGISIDTYDFNSIPFSTDSFFKRDSLLIIIVIAIVIIVSLIFLIYF